MAEIGTLVDIMARLRDPERGCPWDVKQDFASVAPYTIEEAYEVADAIDRGDMQELRDELGDLLHAARGEGAWLRDGDRDIALRTRRPATSPLRVAASRSHLDDRTAAALGRMGDIERVGLGSSLKFCRLAEGRIDVYPRFGPTSEWDTAAAQCVLEEAGGAVLRLDGTRLDYGLKENILNPDFIALGDAALPWRDWLGPHADG